MAKTRGRPESLASERRRRRRVGLTLAVLGLALVGLVVVLAVRDPSLRGGGASALPFTLPDQDGRPVTIAADGHPLVVEIMATWCPYCAYFAAYDLPEIAPFVASQGGRIVAINATDRLGIGTPGEKGQPGSGQDGSMALPTGDAQAAYQAEMRRYVEAYPAMAQVTFLSDPDRRVADRFHFTGYPTVVLIDGAGRVVAARGGVVEPDDFRSWFLSSFGGSR